MNNEIDLPMSEDLKIGNKSLDAGQLHIDDICFCGQHPNEQRDP